MQRFCNSKLPSLPHRPTADRCNACGLRAKVSDEDAIAEMSCYGRWGKQVVRKPHLRSKYRVVQLHTCMALGNLKDLQLLEQSLAENEAEVGALHKGSGLLLYLLPSQAIL